MGGLSGEDGGLLPRLYLGLPHEKMHRESVFSMLYALSVFVVLPCALVAGWAVYIAGDKQISPTGTSSFVGFSLATASALLALGTFVYGIATGGFRHYDPRLLTIYAVGCLLSLSGVISGIAGVWRSNPLRWLAPFCALGTLVFWVVSMSLE